MQVGYVPHETQPGPKKGGWLVRFLLAVAKAIKPPKGERSMPYALALAILAPCAFASEPPATVRGSIGMQAVASEKAAAVPNAEFDVDAPMSLGHESIARVMAQLKAAGVAGDTKFNPGDVSTFNSAEFDLFIKRRVGSDNDGGATYVYVNGGGAVLRDAKGDAPYQRNPFWYSVGVTLERRDEGKFPKRWLSIGLGHSDISSPPAHAPDSLAQAGHDAIPRDLIASGSVAIDGPSKAKKAKLIISGDVHRGIYGPRATTQVRLSTTMTWGG
jgi:hypothetical protein